MCRDPHRTVYGYDRKLYGRKCGPTGRNRHRKELSKALTVTVCFGPLGGHCVANFEAQIFPQRETDILSSSSFRITKFGCCIYGRKVTVYGRILTVFTGYGRMAPNSESSDTPVGPRHDTKRPSNFVWQWSSLLCVTGNLTRHWRAASNNSDNVSEAPNLHFKITAGAKGVNLNQMSIEPTPDVNRQNRPSPALHYSHFYGGEMHFGGSEILCIMRKFGSTLRSQREKRGVNINQMSLASGHARNLAPSGGMAPATSCPRYDIPGCTSCRVGGRTDSQPPASPSRRRLHHSSSHTPFAAARRAVCVCEAEVSDNEEQRWRGGQDEDGGRDGMGEQRSRGRSSAGGGCEHWGMRERDGGRGTGRGRVSYGQERGGGGGRMEGCEYRRNQGGWARSGGRGQRERASSTTPIPPSYGRDNTRGRSPRIRRCIASRSHLAPPASSLNIRHVEREWCHLARRRRRGVTNRSVSIPSFAFPSAIHPVACPSFASGSIASYSMLVARRARKSAEAEAGLCEQRISHRKAKQMHKWGKMGRGARWDCISRGVRRGGGGGNRRAESEKRKQDDEEERDGEKAARRRRRRWKDEGRDGGSARIAEGAGGEQGGGGSTSARGMAESTRAVREGAGARAWSLRARRAGTDGGRRVDSR
ncbi:hypothetical protein DFH09DRAFT_1103125 [Mycena vulgaris]|nr:hypothetical protein DFH09DRAFT_1103125 [Mycena vulgaris]